MGCETEVVYFAGICRLGYRQTWPIRMPRARTRGRSARTSGLLGWILLVRLRIAIEGAFEASAAMGPALSVRDPRPGRGITGRGRIAIGDQRAL